MGINGPECNSGVDIFQALSPSKFCENSSKPFLSDTVMPKIIEVFCLQSLLEINFMPNGAFGLFIYVEGDFLMKSVDFFNLPNTSGRTMALGSAQPLTELSIRNILGGKERPVCKADLTTIREPIV
jgi:hypothetical protein